MSTLTERVALVTGGTSGIGATTVETLAQEGAKVLFTGRRAEQGTSLQDNLRAKGLEVTFYQADVAEPEEVRASVQATIDTYGGLDIAFNNAGIEGGMGPIQDQTLEDFDRVMNINVRGLWLSVQEEVKYMAEHGGGSIINNASVAGHIGLAGVSPYIASKHAVMGITRTVALETAPIRIRVNAVSPGGVHTEMLDRFTGGTEEGLNGLASMHPIGRVGTPQEIADGVLFLASDASSFMTGQSLTLDGGWTAQ